MPRERQFDTYPHGHYLALITAALEQPGGVMVPCSQREAMSLRGEVYAWRRVCEKHPEEAAAYGIQVPVIREVSLQVKPEGLLAMRMTDLRGPKLIEAALGRPIGMPTSAAQQMADTAAQSLASLMEKIHAKED